MTSLAWVGRMVMIYGGIPVFVAGVLGGLLNSIVFLSLRTFRESSCAFYLTVMSILNIGQLFSGLLSRILVALIGIDGTETSVFYCKFRPFIFQACIFSSLTCFCLATIDQCCATCSRLRCQQWCHIKLAQRVTMINLLVWILHGIPYLIYFDHVPSAQISGKISCSSTNPGFAQYRTYIILFVLSGFLPVVIPTVFGWMAYRNVQQIAYRTVPLVRRELDRQLTKMVLVQVIVNVFTLLPYTIVNVLSVNASLISNSITQASLQLASTITLVIYYLYFSVSIIQLE
jgi:hypothetical protein